MDAIMMNMDEQHNAAQHQHQQTPFKATFLGKTVRFDMSAPTYELLVQELNKRFAGFRDVQYLDDEGDVIVMSTDQELRQAITLSKGCVKLMLGKIINCKKTGKGGIKTEQGRIRKWLQRQEPDRHAEWEPHLQTLNEMGFLRFRQNLKVLRSQEGDLQKTIEILNLRKGKEEERLQHRELKKLERDAKKRKRESGDFKHKNKKRRGESRDADQSSGSFPPDDNAAHFRSLATFVDLPGAFPSDKFTHVFVDGNNMFYLTNKLRQFTLKGNAITSEKVLVSVARYFSEVVRLRTEIVFDYASVNTDSGIVSLPNGSAFLVSSARPEFPTSDAKFLAWARANPDVVSHALVVTSDRALAGELHSLGVSIAKPGTWLSCVARMAGSSDEGSWKTWLDAWIDKAVADE